MKRLSFKKKIQQDYHKTAIDLKNMEKMRNEIATDIIEKVSQSKMHLKCILVSPMVSMWAVQIY